MLVWNVRCDLRIIWFLGKQYNFDQMQEFVISQIVASTFSGVVKKFMNNYVKFPQDSMYQTSPKLVYFQRLFKKKKGKC